MESDEIQRALEHTPPDTPVWVEVDGKGYLVKSMDHEEVGIVFRIEDEFFWWQTEDSA